MFNSIHRIISVPSDGARVGHGAVLQCRASSYPYIVESVLNLPLVKGRSWKVSFLIFQIYTSIIDF